VTPWRCAMTTMRRSRTRSLADSPIVRRSREKTNAWCARCPRGRERRDR
jgi:hypothetical protein